MEAGTKFFRTIAAPLLAAGMTCALFYVPCSSAMPLPDVKLGPQPQQIIYITLGDPAHTVCGIWDGVDEQGSVVSGAIYCNGEHVPPDDPRFPRTLRNKLWI